jgi:hypothetical protein
VNVEGEPGFGFAVEVADGGEDTPPIAVDSVDVGLPGLPVVPATESAPTVGAVPRGFVQRDQSTWSTRRTAMIKRTANRVLRSMK